MRATEALWLSDPVTELSKENYELCTHLDTVKQRKEIIKVRKQNRKDALRIIANLNPWLSNEQVRAKYASFGQR